MIFRDFQIFLCFVWPRKIFFHKNFEYFLNSIIMNVHETSISGILFVQLRWKPAVLAIDFGRKRVTFGHFLWEIDYQKWHVWQEPNLRWAVTYCKPREAIFWSSIIPKPGRDLPAPRDVWCGVTLYSFLNNSSQNWNNADPPPPAGGCDPGPAEWASSKTCGAPPIPAGVF